MACKNVSPPGLGSARRALGIALSCALLTAAHAQIRTDGTLGGAAQTLPGPNFVIKETVGRLAGSNLFHSFQVFNVGDAESATFVTTTPALANVISRVTGGTASQINGLVKLDSANAAPNFFFINPAGVVFGKGAQIEVPAGFHVSTANYVRFPDGNFYADPKAVSTLSSAVPEAFGFLGTTRAAIAIKDGAILQTLSTKADQPLGIVAGDIGIDGARVQTFGSDIRAVAVGSGVQEVGLTGALPAASGKLDILNGSLLFSRTSDATRAGDLLVSAGDVRIDGGGNGGTGLSTRALAGAGNTGNVDVIAHGTLSIANGGAIASTTSSSGQAGAVTVTAGEAFIDRRGSSVFTGIRSQANSGSTGDAGSVDVATRGMLSIFDGGAITSTTFGAGRSGPIKVTAGDIVVDGQAATTGTQIASQAQAGTGSAGNVDIAVRSTLSVVNGASITADTYTSGQAGSVKVTAGKLSMVDGGVISSTTFGSGRGGAVSVTADEIVIDGQPQSRFTGIASQTSFGTGNAGSVDVTASGRLSIVNGGYITSDTFASGQAGAVKVAAGELSIADGGAIFASSFAAGQAGSIDVTASKLSIVDAAISADTFASGHAGAIKVTAGDIVIDGRADLRFTGIASQADEGSRGNAGSIDVTARGSLSIFNAVIASSTFASGRAGSVRVGAATIVADSSLIGAVAAVGSSGQTGTVTVEASDAITLSNRASLNIRNNATVANPGSLATTLLSVSAPNIALESGGEITARSLGNVAASNIAVNFGPQLTVIDAGIRTSAKDGNGGSITVTGTGTLVLQNGQITTSVTGTRGNGGDIGVAAPILVMQTGFIQANTAAANASGGEVNIQVGTLLPSGGTLFVGGATPYAFAPGVFGFNVIQAAAPDGVSGTIRISTPVLDITGSLSALPTGYLDTGGLGRSPCAIVGGSSLSQAGRGGLPPAAGDLLWIDPVFEVPAAAAAGWQGAVTLVPRVTGIADKGAAATIPCWRVQS